MIDHKDYLNIKKKVPILIHFKIPEGLRKELNTQLDYLPLWIVADKEVENKIKNLEIAIGIDELWLRIKEGVDIQAQKTLSLILIKERVSQFLALLTVVNEFNGKIINLSITKTEPVAKTETKKKTNLELFK